MKLRTFGITAIAVGAVVFGSLAGAIPASAATKTLYVSPSGSGSCAKAHPCSLPKALAKARSGTKIKLHGGSYGSFDLSGFDQLTSVKKNVVVSPLTSKTPTFDRLLSRVAHVTWRKIRVTGVWYLSRGANYSHIEKSHLDGTGLFIRANHIVVKDSTFEGGDSIDGMQIGGASHVLVTRNVVHDYNQNKNDGLHADCVQIFDSSHVTLRANKLRNCYNAGIILSGGRDPHLDHLTIESNFVQGCITISPACRGGSAADLRWVGAKQLVVRNNTFANGAVRLADQPARVFDRNIVGYLSDCGAHVTNSVILGWNKKVCSKPSAVGSKGNRTAKVSFVNRPAGNLHLTKPHQARISPKGSLKPAATNIDGRRSTAKVAGADF
ncbi:hypothetical protein BH11ACT2_BH11ACT2_17070 [soil metagenome]